MLNGLLCLCLGGLVVFLCNSKHKTNVSDARRKRRGHNALTLFLLFAPSGRLRPVLLDDGQSRQIRTRLIRFTLGVQLLVVGSSPLLVQLLALATRQLRSRRGGAAAGRRRRHIDLGHLGDLSSHMVWVLRFDQAGDALLLAVFVVAAALLLAALLFLGAAACLLFGLLLGAGVLRLLAFGVRIAVGSASLETISGSVSEWQCPYRRQYLLLQLLLLVLLLQLLGASEIAAAAFVVNVLSCRRVQTQDADTDYIEVMCVYLYSYR